MSMDNPLEDARRLFDEHRYEEALRLLRIPLRREGHVTTAGELASTILWMRGEDLPRALIDDPAFDSLFAECEVCRAEGVSAIWIPPPYDRERPNAIISTINTPGGRCPACGAIRCRMHLRVEGVTLVCPNDGKAIDVCFEPNGRFPHRIPPPRGSVRFVVVAREGPLVPTVDYARTLLGRVAPELLQELSAGGLIACRVEDPTDQEAILFYVTAIVLREYGRNALRGCTASLHVVADSESEVAAVIVVFYRPAGLRWWLAKMFGR